MNVGMPNGLSCSVADVDTDVVCVWPVLLVQNPFDDTHHLPHGRLLLRTEAEEIGDMTARNNQGVAGTDRKNIRDGRGQIIACDLFR